MDADDSKSSVILTHFTFYTLKKETERNGYSDECIMQTLNSTFQRTILYLSLCFFCSLLSDNGLFRIELSAKTSPYKYNWQQQFHIAAK